jgi:hypothetical protein
VKEMVANLGDRYSAFLIPEEYRLAIRHPLPSELKYLAYRYTGIGMEVKYQSENPCAVKNFEVSGIKNKLHGVKEEWQENLEQYAQWSSAIHLVSNSQDDACCSESFCTAILLRSLSRIPV